MRGCFDGKLRLRYPSVWATSASRFGEPDESICRKAVNRNKNFIYIY